MIFNDQTAKFISDDVALSDRSHSNSQMGDSVKGYIHIEKGKYQVRDNYMYGSIKNSDDSNELFGATDSENFLAKSQHQLSSGGHRVTVAEETRQRDNLDLITRPQKSKSNIDDGQSDTESLARESHSVGRL